MSKSPNERFLELSLKNSPIEVVFFDNEKRAFFPKGQCWNLREQCSLEYFVEKFVASKDQYKVIDMYDQTLLGQNIQTEISTKKFGIQDMFTTHLKKQGVFFFFIKQKNWLQNLNGLLCIVINNDNVIEFVSKILSNELGISPQIFLGKQIDDIISAEKILTGNIVELHKKNNQIMRVKLIIEETPNLRIITMLPVPDSTKISDVNKHSDLFKSLPIPYIIVDAFGKIEWFNDKFAHDIAISGEKITNRMIGSWLKCSDKDKITELLENQENFRLYNKNKAYQVNCHSVSRENDEIYYSLTLVDVSNIEEREQQIELAKNFQTLGKITSSIIHDFNNILTAIKGMCDLVEKQQNYSEEGDHIFSMKESITKASKLVNTILTFSKHNNTEIKEINLMEQINIIYPLLQRIVGSKIYLSITCDDHNPIITFDINGLERIIVNLISNAKDAMPNGGSITIQIKEFIVSDDGKKDNLIPQGKYKSLSIEDNGTGMSKAVIQKIFQPFFSTKKEHGTGLGLSNVKEILSNNNSYIIVESILKRGSKFILLFPIKTIHSGNFLNKSIANKFDELKNIANNNNFANHQSVKSNNNLFLQNKMINLQNQRDNKINVNNNIVNNFNPSRANFMQQQHIQTALELNKKFLQKQQILNQQNNQATATPTVNNTLPQIVNKSNEKIDNEKIEQIQVLKNVKPEVKNMKILIIDDDDNVRAFLTKALKMITPNVVDTSNGLNAISIARIQQFDIIATDVEMIEINGPEVITKIKKIQPNVKVLFLSGYDKNVIKLGKKYKYHFLAKPFGLNELHDMVFQIAEEIANKI